MKVREPGVLDTSEIFINSTHPSTSPFFYKLLCVGHFYCDGLYKVVNNSLESFLVIYVKEGSGYTVENMRRSDLTKGQMILLDVYDRPSYGTDTGWEIFWLHFDGLESKKLYDALSPDRTVTLNTEGVERDFANILLPFEKGEVPSEAEHNKHITSLLTTFFARQTDEKPLEHRRFEGTCSYINKNLSKRLPIDELSANANLSSSYFIRAFTKEVGMTPHEYIIRARVDLSIYLLRATGLSLKEITYKCGFSNEGAFNNLFKRHMGYTPSVYRKTIRGNLNQTGPEIRPV